MIKDKANAIIVEYSCLNQKFTYKPFSHKANESSLDELYDLVIDNTVFYAFDEDEILSLHDSLGILDDLKSAAKYAFAERLPKRKDPNSDGTLGEVLLDLLIQAYEPHSQKLIARAKYIEVGKKSEITGYDALYFTKNDDTITLWLGQAKAGAQTYCKRDIKEDLNTKFSTTYFAGTAFYISTRTSSKELLDIMNEINSLCFTAIKNNFSKKEKTEQLFYVLQKHKVNIKIPCLLAYTNNIYSDPLLLQKEIEKCTQQMCTYFDANTYSIGIPLSYDIIFYVFPIKDVSYIRERIGAIKKEVV